MEYSSLARISNTISMFVFILILILTQRSLYDIILGRVIAFLISFILATYILLKKFEKPNFASVNLNSLRTILYSAFPFFLINIIFIVYFNVDIIMLSKLKGELYVGWYAPAANDFFFGLFIVPRTFTTVLFPNFSRTFKESLKTFERNVTLTIKVVITLGIALGAGSFILAPKIINLLYGSEFQNSIGVLRVISIAILFSFVGDILSYALTAAEKIRKIVVINLLSLGLIICLNLFFIPLYGHIGAAITSVICLFFSSLLTFIFLKKEAQGITILPHLPKPLLASGMMILMIFLFYNLNLFLLITLGGFTYLLVLLFWGNFNKQELIMLKNSFIITS